ncbi:hypothetical protein Y032_0120g901 [Ancylostoma ceylanicum]|uniref:Reverse transcriptase domain-containing protein n=1 Tax=Ancylostoma ceylanicum TaxID=53326 RepID=A0A016TAN5_9BILA|nr:hypothetical protein Y032_0120g901 [Ancylostoma ceylanicum]
MRERGIPEYIVKMIQDMYEGATTRVRTVHGTTSKFTIAVGVHQGSTLSPFHFKMAPDTVLKLLLERPPFTLMYSDDVALFADSRAELQLKVQKWQLALADSGLELNTKKTEVMSSIKEDGPVFDANETVLAQTKEFKYLGVQVRVLSTYGTVDAAVRGRIKCAWLK